MPCFIALFGFSPDSYLSLSSITHSSSLFSSFSILARISTPPPALSFPFSLIEYETVSSFSTEDAQSGVTN